jgi:hypothetical protein
VCRVLSKSKESNSAKSLAARTRNSPSGVQKVSRVSRFFDRSGRDRCVCLCRRNHSLVNEASRSRMALVDCMKDVCMYPPPHLVNEASRSRMALVDFCLVSCLGFRV